MSLRSYFNSLEPHFEKGGKYEKYYPIFEMVETIFFTSNTTIRFKYLSVQQITIITFFYNFFYISN